MGTKRIAIGVVLVMALLMMTLLVLVPSKVTLAETDFGDSDVDVEPNEYKDAEVELNTDYFHDPSLYRQKGDFSEEQKKLTFRRKENDVFKQVTGQLFLRDTKEHNTIAAKAAELKLFSTHDRRPSHTVEDERDNAAASSSLTILYIVLIAIGTLLLFLLLIPRGLRKGKEQS
ncbi:type VII secretion protein EssA [Numidum massiliense]|uniref:type VII secretion protein EssA n=1 Tax=Numidum massiliense TaxID=1522315 RepID=UPI0006D57A1D|nr:type VII secretion protein EssA [Numidum massiliense]